MRPLRLRMQAFGPYAREVIIDFRSLAAGGLFLIHGQTGAGKTSILDGICYALFGSSSGADRSAEGMRCDLAAPETPTEVVLEFALGADLYRVLRSPRQTLKKLRGEGTRTATPKGELFKLETGRRAEEIDTEDYWRPLTSGDKKTDELVGDLLGMSEEQFRQVVVLPQGQFRKFLSSSSDEREELLEALFRTEKFRRLAEHLSAKEKGLHAEITSLRQNLQAHLSSFEAQSLEDLEKKTVDDEGKLEALRSGASNIEDRYREASERWNRAKAAAKLRDDHTACQRKFETLQTKKPEIDSYIVKLENDRRSRPVLSFDRAVGLIEKNLAELEEAKRLEDVRAKTAARSLEESQSKKTELDQRAPEIAALKDEQQNLRIAWQNAKQLLEDQTLLAQAKQSLHECEQKTSEAEKTLNSAQSRATALKLEIETLSNTAARLEALRAECRIKNSLFESIEKESRGLSELRGRENELKRSIEQARLNCEEKESALKKLKLDYHLSQAALLARELKDGDACPVCGSDKHPARAVLHLERELPSAEMLEAAEQQAKLASETLSSSKARHESLTNEIRECLKRLAALIESNAASEVDLQTELSAKLAIIRSELDTFKDQIATAEKAESQLKTSRASLLQLEKEMAQLGELYQTRVRSRDEQRSKVDGAAATVSRLESQVPAHLRDLEKIKAEGQALSLRLKEFETQLAAVNEKHEAALRDEAGARATIETLTQQIKIKLSELASSIEDRSLALASSGFETLEAARRAGLEPNESERIESLRRTFEADWAVVVAKLEEATRELENLPAWAHELQAREAEYRAIDEERNRTRGETHAIEDRIRQLRQASARLQEVARELSAKETSYKTLGRLAGVAGGHPPYNLSRVNFPRFVLAARLDEVLEQASRRLFQMSRGQFILKRASAQGDKRRSAGLELEVEDSYSGTSRPTASLSGGEGFMASLCLALGLADVVQSQLGGVRLDAVFVDEGFGSLDPESLEGAMKALGELQDGGRLVGVISHVTDLKDQIARRLFVRKTERGSTATWNFSSEINYSHGTLQSNSLEFPFT